MPPRRINPLCTVHNSAREFGVGHSGRCRCIAGLSAPKGQGGGARWSLCCRSGATTGLAYPSDVWGRHLAVYLRTPRLRAAPCPMSDQFAGRPAEMLTRLSWRNLDTQYCTVLSSRQLHAGPLPVFGLSYFAMPYGPVQSARSRSSTVSKASHTRPGDRALGPCRLRRCIGNYPPVQSKTPPGQEPSPTSIVRGVSTVSDRRRPRCGGVSDMRGSRELVRDVN
jgi:hypothetical protein